MKPFQELTYLGQTRRLRRLAQSALQDYGLGDARLKLIAHEENTTFRVDAPHAAPGKATPGPYVENRFLLRLHLPGYQSAEAIASELAWLAALRKEAGLAVPEPVRTLRGEFLTEARAPGMPEQRVCSLLRWMRGRFHERRPRPAHFAAMGQLVARLHEHAARWQLPPTFTRRPWDWEGLFGDDDAGFNLSGQAWTLLPQPYRELFQAAARHIGRIMRQLGQGADVYGLIHADLTLANVLFSGGEARAIDFDDCGSGYWVYDLAVVLYECLEHENRLAFRAALLDGYTRVRPLPQEQLLQLDAFIMARVVTLVLWEIDRAEVNPSFRQGLARRFAWSAGHVRKFMAER